MKKYPKIRTENIVIQEMEDEVLVYDTKQNKALCLNETSLLVWEMCDGKTSSAEIAMQATAKLGETVSEEFVWLALDQLRKEELLETNDEISSEFIGLSRREVIRKVGLTSMVVLPIVSSIVAPASADAQSCVPAGGQAGFISCVAPGPACDCSPRSSNCCPGASAFPNTCVPAGAGVQTCSCICQIP